MTAVDDKDCAILAELQERGDLANVELARRVGLSPAATLRRVQRLRNEGVIEEIRAVVSPEAIGLGVQAFVLLSRDDHSPANDARFARELGQVPAILRADAISGPHDVLLHVAAADARDLQRVLLTLSRLGAKDILTLLRLQAVKPPAPVPVRPRV